jgi:hypothetical protein
MRKKVMLGSLVVAVGLFTGCATNINIDEYPNKIRQTYQVPEVCEAEYEKLKNIPRVAIVKFTNNSSFNKANVETKNGEANYEGAAVAGIVAGKNGVGIGVASKEHVDVHTNKTSRVVDPKLDKAITSALEGILAELGGAEVYSREDLDKIIKEQKLQQSGLFDENTLVQVGKLAGVKYIITGSIDSVTQKYEDYTKGAQIATENSKKNDLIGTLLKTALNAGASAASGMKITTRVTFKIIDVETGKIVASVQKEETKNIGQIKNPTYDQIIGGIKDDIMEALQAAKTELSEFFGVKGYVLQVRTDKDRKNYIAQINLGKKDKVKPGQTFSVYKFEENEDPISHEVTCDKVTMNVKLKVSDNQLQEKRAWTVAEGDDAPSIRPGQIIKRDAIKNSLF